ncbi:MAG: acyl-CoA dehydrogenase, partial [Rhodothermales bacterium]|nr:acyl-CoA dehydrogenase [Rhodothermales bacterium]
MDLPYFEFLSGTETWMVVAAAALVVFVLGFTGAPLLVWAAFTFVLLYGLGAPMWVWLVVAIPVALLTIPPLRRMISLGVMKTLGALDFLPAISATEKEAIDAGTVWVEGELFSGKPDFKRILSESYPDLSDEEQAFVDGPVQTVCEMTNDWEVFQNRDLPDEVWAYMKENKFLGMIIPKKYGGLGFSASANSAVVAKLASSSTVLGISVMVPNSLGPAELLIHYGTDKQKNHYLPRLADGLDIPAFALTESNAGSDAGGLQSSGEVFKGEDGELYVRLNWRKRYITLAAISTVLGLAFKLRDPDNLLGKGTNLGITCALVPTDAEGVVLGMRHDPMGVPFYNCPT